MERIRLGTFDVIVEDCPGRRAIDVATAIGSGHRDDPVDRSGTAHLAEHVLARVAAVHELQGYGANFSATTHGGHLESRTVAPVGLADEVLRREARRLFAPARICEQDFERQRAAVLNEIAALNESDSPWPELGQAVFGEDSLLARDGMGIENDVCSVDAGDVSHFVDTARMRGGAIVVSADLTAIGGIASVMKALHPGRPRSDRAVHTPLRPGSRPGNGACRGRVSVPWLGWRIPGFAEDLHEHILVAAVGEILRRRGLSVRVGRSGPLYSADTDIFALAIPPGQSEVCAKIAEPCTRSELEAAMSELERITRECETGTLLRARSTTLLRDTEDLADTVNTVIDELSTDDLTRRLTRFASAPEGRVDPIRDSTPARPGRFSFAQHPGSEDAEGSLLVERSFLTNSLMHVPTRTDSMYACEWLAVAMLNSIDRLAHGRAPIVRAARPVPAGPLLRLDTSIKELTDVVDSADVDTISELACFCAGQTLVETADSPWPGHNPHAEMFAAELLDADPDLVRAAGYRLALHSVSGA